MGQGENLIASSLLDSSPTAILEFFRIYPDTLEKPTTFIPIHGGSNFQKSIFWQGEEYLPLPIECEGFETTSTSRLSRPKIRIANKDLLVSNLLQNNKDFKNAKITRKRTFLKYIDDRNFDGGNPFGTANFNAEISSEDFLVAQKTAENKSFVEMELTSPLDVDNFELNNRKILAKYCYWQYRGCGCNYKGLPVQRENGDSFRDSAGSAVAPTPYANTGFEENPRYIWNKYKSYVKGELVCIVNRKILVQLRPKDIGKNSIKQSSFLRNWYVCVQDNSGQNPDSNTNFWQVDGCQKTLSACKLRFNDSYYQSWKKYESFKSEPVALFSPSDATETAEVSYGHDFSIVSSATSATRFSWSGAYNDAISKGGRLAVIDEPYKQGIINELLRVFKTPLGGNSDPYPLMWINGTTPSGFSGAGDSINFRWEGTGKVIVNGFTNYYVDSFLNKEPNRSAQTDSLLGANTKEAYLHMYGYSVSTPSEFGKWNDLTLNSTTSYPVYHYILEKKSKTKTQKGGGYLSISDTRLLDVMQNSFTLHGWFVDSGSIAGAGLISTTSSKSKTVYNSNGFSQNPYADGGIVANSWWDIVSKQSIGRTMVDYAKEADYALWENNKTYYDNFNSFNISILNANTLRLKYKSSDARTISRTSNVYDITYTPQNLNSITLVVSKRKSAPHNLFTRSEDFINNIWAKSGCSIVSTTSGQLVLPQNGAKKASVGSFDLNSDFCENWGRPSGISSYAYENVEWYTYIAAIERIYGSYKASQSVKKFSELERARFSIYVKPINPASGTHAYLKHIEWQSDDGGYYFDEHVAFDLKNTSVLRISGGNKDNYNVNDATITQEANGWYRLSALVLKDDNQSRALMGVEYGIIPSGANLVREPFTLQQYKNWVKNHFQGHLDVVKTAALPNRALSLVQTTSSNRTFNGSSGQGMLFSGAQLENGINKPGKYFKTTSAPYVHPNFNSYVGDYLALYINGESKHVFNNSRDERLQLDVNVETFKIGSDNSRPDFMERKLKGGVASLMLWSGEKTIGALENEFPIGRAVTTKKDVNGKYFPIEYDVSVIEGNLQAFWDMPDEFQDFPITNNLTEYPKSEYELTVNGEFNTTTFDYRLKVDENSQRAIEFTSLSFGGFPGTNGYSYA